MREPPILPIVAAAGGVAVPALLYILINTDPVTHRGWAIPTATDIAFAVGVLSLSGRVPPTLRMLLLTLAIIDDIAAILVIALVYSGGIAYAGLLLVGAGVLLILAMQWLGIRPALAYAVPGALAWYGMLRAGMHPTLAGVILGLLTPVHAELRAPAPGLRGSHRPVTRAAAGKTPAPVGGLRHHAAVRARQRGRDAVGTQSVGRPAAERGGRHRRRARAR